MSRFLQQVVATFVRKGDKTIHKPTKAKKAKKVKDHGRDKGHIAPFKPNQPIKPNKARKPQTIKPGRATADRNQKVQTNFVHLRNFITELEADMQMTDPFDINDPTWLAFFKKAAPGLMVSVLWDLQHVNDSRDRRALKVLFNQRIRA